MVVNQLVPQQRFTDVLGDRHEIDLPMGPRLVPLHPTINPERGAFVVGPVVLVADRGSANPWLELAPSYPASALSPTGVPLEFRFSGNPEPVTFRPFYRYGEGQKYWMYFDVPRD